MKVIKSAFKWIGIIIWLFLIFAFMQVPAVEETPLYSIDSQQQFIEAYRHVNLLHNILMAIIFIVITFIMEWYVCTWLKNRLNFSKKLSKKYLILIAPTLEELLFQASIQKGVFRNLTPWLAIILTSIIFAAAHDITLNLTFFHRVLSGIIYGYIYQKTDDIKMAILSHSISNLLPLIICCILAWT